MSRKDTKCGKRTCTGLDRHRQAYNPDAQRQAEEELSKHGIEVQDFCIHAVEIKRRVEQEKALERVRRIEERQEATAAWALWEEAAGKEISDDSSLRFLTDAKRYAEHHNTQGGNFKSDV